MENNYVDWDAETKRAWRQTMQEGLCAAIRRGSQQASASQRARRDGRDMSRWLRAEDPKADNATIPIAAKVQHAEATNGYVHGRHDNDVGSNNWKDTRWTNGDLFVRVKLDRLPGGLVWMERGGKQFCHFTVFRLPEPAARCGYRDQGRNCACSRFEGEPLRHS